MTDSNTVERRQGMIVHISSYPIFIGFDSILLTNLPVNGVDIEYHRSMKLANGWAMQPTQGWRTADGRLKLYRWRGKWRVGIIHTSSWTTMTEDKRRLDAAGITGETGLSLRQLTHLACEITGAQPTLTRAHRHFNSEYGVFADSHWLAIIERRNDGWHLKPSSQMITQSNLDISSTDYLQLSAAFFDQDYRCLKKDHVFATRQGAIEHLQAVATHYPRPVPTH